MALRVQTERESGEGRRIEGGVVGERKTGRKKIWWEGRREWKGREEVEECKAGNVKGGRKEGRT